MAREKFAQTLDYLFGEGSSLAFPLDELNFEFSPRTKRLKRVFFQNKLLATFREDGSLALTLNGAEILSKSKRFLENCVIVKDLAEEPIRKGRSIFVKHLNYVGDRIRINGEVIVLNTKREIIAIGKAKLSSNMMKSFKRGLAVKVREGKLSDGY